MNIPNSPVVSPVPQDTLPSTFDVRRSTFDVQPPPSLPSVKESDLRKALLRLNIVQKAAPLLQSGLSMLATSRKLRVKNNNLDRWYKRWITGGMTLEALIDKPKPGCPPKYKFSTQEIAIVKSHKLGTNRTHDSSSTPEAIRRAIKAGQIRPELATALLDREAQGKRFIPESMQNDLHISEAAIRTYRQPRETWLDMVESPGSLMITKDELTGEEREWYPGEAMTIDDASINFGCWIPMQRAGDKCSENFGCILGRFQFIPVVDHRTLCIVGFNYTARPRDSYRAEDITATFQAVFAEHGRPRVMFLEHGVSDSKLVNDTLNLLGVEPRHVASPHQKVVEARFNLLWTKLSHLPGQIGRYRGEEEQTGKIYQACKQGQKDPRKHFSSLAEVLKALREAIHETNAQWVDSKQYGRWIPAEWFARSASAHTRKLPAGSEWIFSPCVKGPLTVKKYNLSTTFTMMEGLSIQFDFAAEFLGDIIGAEVKIHFNPFTPNSSAAVVLADEYHGTPTGTLMGMAEQTNQYARFTKRMLGYSTEEDIGGKVVKQNAQALRRTIQAIRPDGKPGITTVEARSYATSPAAPQSSVLCPLPSDPPRDRSQNRALAEEARRLRDLQDDNPF